MSYKKDIIRLRKRGKSYDEIENELDCAKGTISYHCKNEGFENIGKKQNKLADEKIEQIKKLRKQGYTYDEIEEKADVSKSSARKYGKNVTKKEKEYITNQNLCRTCGEEKPLTEFYKKSDTNGYYNQCKSCRNKDKAKRSKQYKKRLVEHLGGECEECGYSKCYSALEFHHKNPSEKEIKLSRTGSYSFEQLKKEVEKCKLVCANCHRETECSRKMCNH